MLSTIRPRSTSNKNNDKQQLAMSFSIVDNNDRNKKKNYQNIPNRTQKQWITFIIISILLTTLLVFTFLTYFTTTHTGIITYTFLHRKTNSKTSYYFRDIESMASPFPSLLDFKSYNDINGIAPFLIDIVYNYGGYQTNTVDIHSRDHGELQYSLRSIYSHIPWFNTIYIICPDELANNLSSSPLWPLWLDINQLNFITQSNNKYHQIKFIAQSSLMYWNTDNAKNNHNSNAFEINMHRIPDLTEHFIYFCDDFFIGRPLSWKFFFSPHQPYIPRMSLSVFEKYFRIQGVNNYRNYKKWPTTYDCDVSEFNEEWKQYSDKLKEFIPSRVERYYSHSPRPLTKTILNQFIGKYPKWFEFVESHKQRYCCPNPDPLKKYKCDRQENLWLTLYKQYIDFDIRIDIMDHPPDEERLNELKYWVSHRDLVGYYHPSFGMYRKTNRILEIKPYTFSINDYYSRAQNLTKYLLQFRKFINFTNTYWPNQAIFEIKYDSMNDMPWKELEKDLELKIEMEKENNLELPLKNTDSYISYIF